MPQWDVMALFSRYPCFIRRKYDIVIRQAYALERLCLRETLKIADSMSETGKGQESGRKPVEKCHYGITRFLI